MNQITITELRSHLPRYISKVSKGEGVLVTSHGKVVARILPPIETSQNAKNKLFKLRETCKIGDIISPVSSS